MANQHKRTSSGENLSKHKETTAASWKLLSTFTSSSDSYRFNLLSLNFTALKGVNYTHVYKDA